MNPRGKRNVVIPSEEWGRKGNPKIMSACQGEKENKQAVIVFLVGGGGQRYFAEGEKKGRGDAPLLPFPHEGHRKEKGISFPQ